LGEYGGVVLRTLTGRFRWRLVLVLFACGQILSCGGASRSSTGSAALATLALDANSLDFGSVAVGGSKSNAIELRNSSPADGPNLVITQAIASDPQFTVKAPTMPITLGVGQTASLTISFVPRSAGANNGRLSITVQGQNQPAVVNLSGIGLAVGQLGTNPAAMNIGNVAIGHSQTQTGSLTAGGADVNISTASWTGAGYALGGIHFPVTVPAGSSIAFSVTFTPQSAGTATGQVSFFSNASNSPSAVNLSATGVQAVQHSVTLSWDSTAPVAGYNIYRSTQANGSYVRLNVSLISASSYTDDAVQSGMTYYYAATSVDSNDVESEYSNVAVASIP
jgi:Abnormal spindle-like microcephaly-assoc'd, ASPM-SPD-2-Hydin